MLVREFLANLYVVRVWRKEQPKALAVVKSDEVSKAYERLKASIENEDLREDLDKLKSSADSGLRVSWWSRRFVFGFDVANAIDEWFRAFDKADPNQPLLARIPRIETSSVAAKWLWFGFYTTLIGVIFSLSIAIITIYYLKSQTNILAKQAENSRVANTNAQRTQYTQILYEMQCKPVVAVPKSKTEADCAPFYSAQARAVALKSLLKLEREVTLRPDFKQAQLSNTDLSEIDLHDVYLNGATLTGSNLGHAILTGANLESAILTGANLESAILIGANLINTNLEGAVLNSADLNKANLKGTNLTNAKLGDANLSPVNLEGVLLINANLSGADLRNSRLWRVDLSGADLLAADIRGTQFSDTKITQLQLDSVCGEERKTFLDRGLSIFPCPDLR